MKSRDFVTLLPVYTDFLWLLFCIVGIFTFLHHCSIKERIWANMEHGKEWVNGQVS